jgi:hypothetical protein
MRTELTFLVLMFLLAVVSSNTSAQQKATDAEDLSSYDVQREVTLLGTVQSYIPHAQTPPLGAHLILQTALGAVDVHLGDSRLLGASRFTIEPGDKLRIIGESVSYGQHTQFVARLVQKGTQVLAVRSIRGFPLSFMAARNSAQAKAQGGSR